MPVRLPRRSPRAGSSQPRSTSSRASPRSTPGCSPLRAWCWHRTSDRLPPRQGLPWLSCAQTACSPCSRGSGPPISSTGRSCSVADAHVLLVTSSGAPSSAVVPVLAAIEAAGMRVRAIDVGGVGEGVGVADRVRRALLGEGAERKLRKELEMSPPDAAVVFDPHAALALTSARDQVMNPAPVIAIVGDLDPVAAWAQSDADRFVAVDDIAAVALQDAGVE